MPHYAEFGINTFVGSPAQGEAYVSSPTPRGFFSVLAWFDFESPGCAVFELRVHLVEGVKDVLRRGLLSSFSLHTRADLFTHLLQLDHLFYKHTQYIAGPSVHAVATDFSEIMQLRQKQCEREGVRYTKCSVLDAAFLVQETLELLPEKELGAMQLQPWCVCIYILLSQLSARFSKEGEHPARWCWCLVMALMMRSY